MFMTQKSLFSSLLPWFDTDILVEQISNSYRVCQENDQNRLRLLPFALTSGPPSPSPPPQLSPPSSPVLHARPLTHLSPPPPCSSASPPARETLAPDPLLPTTALHYPQIRPPRELISDPPHAPPGPLPPPAARRGGGSLRCWGRGDALFENGAPAVRRGAAGGGPARGVVAEARERGVLPRAGEERSPAAEAAARRQVPAPLALQRRQHLLPRQRLWLVRGIPYPCSILLPWTFYSFTTHCECWCYFEIVELWGS